VVAARLVRAGRERPTLVDAAVAALLAVSAVALLRLVANDIARFDPTFDPPGWPALLIAGLTPTVPLAWRRRRPLLVAPVVCVALVAGRIVIDVAEGAATVLAVYLAIYSAALHGRGRWRTVVIAGSVAIVVAEIVREIWFIDAAGEVPTWIMVFTLIYNLVILALPWWLGEAMRLRAEREQQLLSRTIELAREREENARRAVFEERVRIARELHDVVAHHVSTMGVQAGAARRVMERDPAAARSALHTIEESSRHAVGEMHQLLGFLRSDGQSDALAPQPGLRDLDELVEQFRAAGLRVEVAPCTLEQPLPATLQLSIYRIVQEALTNVLRHSGAAAAEVRLVEQDGSLIVEVRDRGAGAASAIRPDGGHGITGMRERAALHGGVLHAAPATGGGFVVEARVPLERRSA